MPTIGKIEGLCADYSQSTLNGRPYDKIYERILEGKDFRFNEMMKRGGIPCELGHPVDFDPEGNPRTETDPTKVAVFLTDVKRGGPKQLIASGDIADTPNGRIFKELAEHYNFGLSSRGSYEVSPELDYEEGPNGWNQDSYTFKGYDLVLLPANPGSVLSVTEGIDPINNKSIIKVAREAIDVNLLAKASQVSEDQVEKALDQLFTIDEDAKPDEEVTVYKMKEKLEQENPESPDNEEVLQEEVTDIVDGDDGEEKIEPSLITDGSEVEKIRADLQTALDEIKALTESKEKDGLEISNRDAEILKLTSDVEGLKAELDERIQESEEFVEQFETLKELSQKLVETYRLAKEQFEVKADEPSPEDEEKAARLNELEREKREAEENLKKERKASVGLRGELAAAKESLISAYAMSFGVTEQALKSSLGKSYSVKKIRPAAEALANQTSRFQSLPVFSAVGKKRSTATESFMATDEIEKELNDLIKNNN